MNNSPFDLDPETGFDRAQSADPLGSSAATGCDDYKPSKLYWHEALDRSHVACDHFYEYVKQHPTVEHDKELEEAATKVTEVMQDFYQLVGRKSHEFDELETES